MDGVRFNLFRFAPSELSHSAFWAWVLQSIDAINKSLAGPRQVALRLLEKVQVPALSSPVEIKTEFELPNISGRLDIHVKDANGVVVAIENKVKAIPNADQLQKYKQALGSKSHLAILSTAFDDDVRRSLPCPYLGLKDLIQIVGPDQDSHPVLSDYSLWLKDLRKQREALARDAHNNNPKVHGPALERPEGQWYLMKTLTATMKGHQVRGMNLDGTAHTQFHFSKADKRHDLLFYRIDALKSKSGKLPYLSIRQYQKDPSPTIEAKRRRLKKLRNWWIEACKKAGKELVPCEPSNKGIKESEVGRFLFAENPPSVLREKLPNVHNAFLDKLASASWTVRPPKTIMRGKCDCGCSTSRYAQS